MRIGASPRAAARLGVLGALAALALAVSPAASHAAYSTPLPTGTPGVSILAQNGFGDRNNSYAWSMAWFKGKIYVGTGRDELCVENETTQFFYPDTKAYVTRPSSDVACPADPFDMPLQAEIWQYTPPFTKKVTYTSGNKTTTITTPVPGQWNMVFKAPEVKNPMARGKMVARDIAYRDMITWRNPQGKEALFAAGVSPDEYLPPLLTSHPPVLMRSFDGVHWQTLRMPSVSVQYPGANSRQMGYRSLVVWRGHLFVTATPDLTGDGALFEVTNPWSNHPGLRQVSGPEFDIFEISTFGGGLYIGTGDLQVGYGVYRTFKYNPHGMFDFHRVVGDGAGRGKVVTSVVAMAPYRNWLYVTANGWYNKGTSAATEIIRIARNGQWQVVVGNPRNLPDGETKYPISGEYDGFFSPFTAHVWRMDVQGGGLYAGTNDWVYELRNNPQVAWLQETALSSVLGFNVWATCDGSDWFSVTRNAFTDDMYNFGGRNLVTGGPQGQDLFIGSANQAQGTTIFEDQDNACGSLVNAPRQGVRRPAALMAESVSHGTLLSWANSPHASSYVVEQAPVLSVTMGLKPPHVARFGWLYDDASPTVTPLGAPGSVAVKLSFPGGFTPVATTTTNDFVAPASGRYVYEVVAKSELGGTSGPSNVVAAPAVGPAPTFASLASAVAPRGTAAHAAVAGRARSPLQLLLAAAENAAAAGENAAAARDVARFAAAAAGNVDVAPIAARIERRLRYARIAGEP